MSMFTATDLIFNVNYVKMNVKKVSGLGKRNYDMYMFDYTVRKIALCLIHL